MSGRRKVTINYKSRNGEDPKAIIRAIVRVAGIESDIEVNIEPDRPDVVTVNSVPNTQVMDEPRETEIVAHTNAKLDQARKARSDKGEDVESRRQAPAAERLEKRRWLKNLLPWTADAAGKDLVNAVFVTVKEWAKEELGQ